MKAWGYWSLNSARGSTSIIYGYSPTVVPKPSDWGANQRITGYWFLDTKEGYQPDEALLDFLAESSPPVYVGFGSMVDHEQEEVTEIVIDALRKTGQRGIMLDGWSALGSGSLPDTIFHINDTPHDWLFPRMAAVVHRGGAGTTVVGMRAGVPSVIAPTFGDQFFWGLRVKELGVKPEPVFRNKLTTVRLAEAIQRAVGDEAIKSKAALLGRQIRAEDGVGVAATLIETFYQQGGLLDLQSPFRQRIGLDLYLFTKYRMWKMISYIWADTLTVSDLQRTVTHWLGRRSPYAVCA